MTPCRRIRAPQGRLPMLTRRIRTTLLEYRDARKRLLRLGVIRTDGPLAGQFAEWAAAGHLRLRLVPSNVHKAHDAVDRAGRTYQIKGRIVSGATAATSFDFRPPMRRFDFLLGVLMSPTFDVLAIIQVPYAAVCSRMQPSAAMPAGIAGGTACAGHDAHSTTLGLTCSTESGGDAVTLHRPNCPWSAATATTAPSARWTRPPRCSRCGRRRPSPCGSASSGVGPALRAARAGDRHRVQPTGPGVDLPHIPPHARAGIARTA